MKMCDCCMSWQANADPSPWDYWNTPESKVEYAKTRLGELFGIRTPEIIGYVEQDKITPLCDVCRYNTASFIVLR